MCERLRRITADGWRYLIRIDYGRLSRRASSVLRHCWPPAQSSCASQSCVPGIRRDIAACSCPWLCSAPLPTGSERPRRIPEAVASLDKVGAGRIAGPQVRIVRGLKILTKYQAVHGAQPRPSVDVTSFLIARRAFRNQNFLRSSTPLGWRRTTRRSTSFRYQSEKRESRG